MGQPAYQEHRGEVAGLREKVIMLENLLLAEADDRAELAKELHRTKSLLGTALAERDRLLAELDRHKAATDEAVRVAARYAKLGPVSHVEPRSVTQADRGAPTTG